MSKHTVRDTFKYLMIPVAVYLFYVLFATVFLSVFSANKAVVVTAIVDVCMILVCLLFMKRFLSDKKLRYKKRMFFDSKLAVWLCMLLFVYFFGQCAATVIYNNMGDMAFDSYTSELNTVSTLIYICLTIAVAPIYEELFFRGVMYRSVKQIMHPLVAAIISALLFAVSHGTIIHVVPTFMLGMLSAIIYEYTDNIVYSIVCHALNNSMTLFFGGIVLPDIMFNPLFLMIGISVILAVIVIMFLTKSFHTLHFHVVGTSASQNSIHTSVAVGDAVELSERVSDDESIENNE